MAVRVTGVKYGLDTMCQKLIPRNDEVSLQGIICQYYDELSSSFSG